MKQITKPTLVINKGRVLANIRRMVARVHRSPGAVRFRPHFKTHQSALIGGWFREMGVNAITVSSVDMAAYFARAGWDDITIGILANPLEVDALNRLRAGGVKTLNLVVDSLAAVYPLAKGLGAIHGPVGVWIKVDTGAHRTGVPWDAGDEMLSLARGIQACPPLVLRGLLTHAGHAYGCGSVAEIKGVYDETVARMNAARDRLKEVGIRDLEVSVGDTPTCSVVDEFHGVDEVRCGNFVFYDVMQLRLGVCSEGDIAAAVACPVLGVYPRRGEVVIHGGAVHLSKEYVGGDRGKIFGLPAYPGMESRDGGDSVGDDWGPVIEGAYVSSLSQEHGIIKAGGSLIDRVGVGDILMILPVHSCLTVNLMRE